MKRWKGILFLIITFIGIALVANNHLGQSYGDMLFQALGIPAWESKGRYGLHFSAIAGIVLLIIGYLGATIYYLPVYRKIRSRIIIGCIVLIWLSPYAAQYTMLALKYQSNGVASVDYLRKDSQCTYRTDDDGLVRASCTLHFYIYGQVEQITIRPVIADRPEISFRPESFHINPHTKLLLNYTFTAEAQLAFSGWSNAVGVEIEAEGETKLVQ